ncbi:ATP-binding protein [Saccharothrix saharensis]|uniref:ATP-binding protein n=1 Tax=Saccharothrix saharensis TaxID=571190 RepID=UPI001478A081|nr:tetratricopeptide repeat protein [Saccharothrix saharensis]
MEIRFAILGPTAVLVDGRLNEEWGALKLRALLGALLARPGSSLPSTELVDWIWGAGDELPNDPTQALYLYASRIRRFLKKSGTDVDIFVDNRNFRLDVDPLSIDYFQFREQLHRARVEARRGEHHRALDLITDAFRMWRQQPLADAAGDSADAWRRRVTKNVLLPAYDTLFAQQLAVGEADAVITRLDELDVDHRSHLALVKRRLQALYALSRHDEATEEFLAVHKALRVDFDDIGARDLREFHDGLQENKPTAAPRVVAARRPNQLPPPLLKLVGHENLLAWLDSVTTTPCLVVVDGPGGVGKTARVVHWAHSRLDRFPDGVLFADLHGFSDSPTVDAAAVVDQFLEALGGVPDRVPDRGRRAARLQAQLNGRQVLVVLDNAGHTDQVRPLLPLLSSSVVIVTSRSHLSGLAVRHAPHRFTVKPLDTDQSVRLLSEHIGPRATTQPRELRDLTDRCGGLPLGLATLANYIAIRPLTSLTDFVDQLNELTLLDLGAIGDGANHGLRAVFGQSVRALAPEAQRLFRLLGAHPGPDFGVGVAAALLDAEPRHARLVLDALVEAHLLEQQGPLGRFKFHDLVKEYAVGLMMSADEHHDAESRVLSYYFRSAENADKAVFPTQARVRTDPAFATHHVAEFTDEVSARLWCLTEMANLMAVIHSFSTRGHGEMRVQLAQLVNLAGQPLLRHGAFPEVLALLQAGYAAVAHEESSIEPQADALQAIATLHLLRRNFAEAEHYAHLAHIKYRLIEDEVGIAACLHTTARIMVETGNTLMGIDSHERALRVVRRTGETGLEITFLYRAAEAYQKAAEYGKAAAYYREALSLARDLGDTTAEGRVLTLLGSLSFDKEQTAEARDFLYEGLRLLERAHDLGTAAMACHGLARVELEFGRVREAVEYGRQALRLSRRAFDPKVEGDSLETLAEALQRRGHRDAAIEAYEQARDIFDDLDPDRARETRRLLNILVTRTVDLPSVRTDTDVQQQRVNPHGR